MTDKLFGSIGFSTCALFFALFIMFMSLSKKRYRDVENRIYFVLLILLFVWIFSEYGYVLCLHNGKTGTLTLFFCRVWMNILMIWQSLLTYYMIIVGTRHITDQEKRKKTLKKIAIVFGIILSIAIIISNLLPIEVNLETSAYTFGGDAVYTGFVLATLAMLVAIHTFLIRKDIITKQQKVPILFAIIIILGATFVQLVDVDLDFNYQSFESVTFLIMLFFTLESQDQKLLEEHEKQTQEAEKLNKEQTEFLTSMSHEIRTPMNAIMGLSEVILREESDDFNVVKHDMDNIHEAAVSLLELINNILDLSRIDSGKEELLDKNFDMKSVLENVNSLAKNNIYTDDVKLTIKVDSTMPSVYSGDSTKLVKVVANLVRNTLDYVSKGNVILDIKQVLDENNNPLLQFYSYGTGEILEHQEIIDYFNDDSRKNIINAKTLGIGLAKQYANMMNGSIIFNSPSKDVFSYVFRYPTSIVNPEPIGNVDILFRELNSDITKLDLSNKRILVIDDNELNTKLFARLLAEYNNTPDQAKSGQEGINLIMANTYDLVFLDHMMPEMDGIETIKKLMDMKKDLPPIVALTANAYSMAKDYYINEGFYNYLAKPINKNELYNLLFNVFNFK